MEIEPVVYQMVAILGALGVLIAVLERCAPRRPGGLWLAPATNAPKRAAELWFLAYGVVWIGAFACIVGFELYESFSAWTYFWVCGGLAAPLWLQPVVAPGLTKDADRPLAERYALKANVWLGVFGFAGNYWYTHYFYSVLGAEYTMPANRLNNVPIAMYFATHFYFCFYHVLSNACLRRVATGYAPGLAKTALRVAVVAALAYLTAFLETLTISGFPYWRFDDRHQAYTVGSAFYGIYFVVSFPAFLLIDETPANVVNGQTHTLRRAFVEALAAAMAVLFLLDFVRLALGIPFKMEIAPFF
mmetsp:Transcript_17933/g.55162  ORF Transcript_17933/g.55162 Transcript_17933/m.55162 type:complete len:302 (-) Transcript_17933:29-934(-)